MILQRVTTLEPKKQVLGICLSLEGKTREAVLEIDIESVNQEDSIQKVLAQLDKIYLKDKIHLAYLAYHLDEHCSFCGRVWAIV